MVKRFKSQQGWNCTKTSPWTLFMGQEIVLIQDSFYGTEGIQFIHTCNRDTFKLYFDATENANQVSDWIEKAASLGINEIELQFTHARKNLMISYHLIDIASLRILKFVNCELYYPVDSNGLRNLREVTLQDSRAQPDMVDAIFTNCAGLRALTLIKCNSVGSLKVTGQSLQKLVVKDCWDVHLIAVLNSACLRTFHYHGKITEFKFYCGLPRLSDVILDIAYPRSFQVLSHRKEVVNTLAFVKTLTISSTVLEGLTARYEEHQYKEMEFCLWKLREFHLLVAPESFTNPSDVIIFLKKCPYIERVFINLGKNAFGKSVYWECYGKYYLNKYEIVFPFLKYVKIKGFTLKELAVCMARYLLKNAIQLQRLILVKARIHYFPEHYTPECLRLGVLSNAQIDIYGYHKDESTIMPLHLRDV